MDAKQHFINNNGKYIKRHIALSGPNLASWPSSRPWAGYLD